MSQELRETLQDPFLELKKSEMEFTFDVPIPIQTQEESSQEFTFLSSKELEMFLLTDDPLSPSSVSPMNTYQAINGGEGYGTNDSDFSLGLETNIASLSSQRYTGLMVPVSGFSNNVKGPDSDITSKLQQAYDNLLRSGEGYGANDSDFFGYESNSCLGSGENIASLSSQTYSEPFGYGMMTNNQNTSTLFQQHGVLSKMEPQWTIIKKLTKTDVTDYSCTLEKTSFKEHILRHLSEEDGLKIVSNKRGITVEVYDHDTCTAHKLCLAFHRCYILKGPLWKEFTIRRALKEGDKIGLLWDCSASKLRFSVLSRAIEMERPRY